MGLTQVNTSSHLGQSYHVGRNKYILKTRIIELETSFRLRQFFRCNSKNVEINFSTEIFFSDVSDRRNV